MSKIYQGFNLKFILQTIKQELGNRAIITKIDESQPLIKVEVADIVSNPEITALIGYPGVGKSIIAAKLCLQAKKSGLTPLLISMDILKCGAVEQSRRYAKAIQINFALAKNPSQLDAILNQNLQNFIVIDTFGINPHLDKDKILLRDFLPSNQKNIGVIALDQQNKDLGFLEEFNCQGIILSRYDLCDINNCSIKSNLPILGINTGPHLLDPISTSISNLIYKHLPHMQSNT